MRTLNVLIACECSGAVCAAFRRLGHNAYSCDLKPADPTHPHPEHHMTGDALAIAKRGCWDPERRAYVPWDLVIAHPPCTFLSNSGALRLYIDGKKANGPDPKRWHNMRDGARFFRSFFTEYDGPLCCENPIMHGHAREIIGSPEETIQSVQPYEFGDDASKATHLWLRGLPHLEKDPAAAFPPRIVMVNGKPRPRWSNQTDGGQNKLGPSPTRQAERAVTYAGIANAMAAQWSAHLTNEFTLR